MPIDISYIFHTTLDLENFHKLLKSSLTKSNSPNYPHYNILKLDINHYRISLALAGFSKNNIEIKLEDDILIIRSIVNNVDKKEYLYKGIANRSFQKKFQLAKNVKVDNAFFENGLLNIDLLKFKAETKKIIKIDIQTKK
ncbi:Hsp20 family protein [Alphaproteobacteria bacterium]|nr:Hsp20 family protein [Alphaproteobacteria bacterium]